MFKSEIKKIGLNIVWITSLVYLVFSLLIFTSDIQIDIITLFFEVFMPLYTAVLVTIVKKPESMKNFLLNSKSYFFVTLRRYLMVIGIIFLMNVLFIGILGLFNEFDHINTMINYIVPSFFLSTLGLLLYLSLKKLKISLAIVGLFWLIQILLAKVLLSSFLNFYFMFITYYSEVSVNWIVNRIVLVLVSIALWHFIYGLLKERKSLLDRGIKKVPMFLGGILFIGILVGSIYVWGFLNGVSSPKIEGNRDELWIHDISYIKDNLPKEHKNLFFQLSKDDFNEEMSLLINDIPNLSDEEIKIRLSNIISKVGDAHTQVGFDTRSLYPFGFFWFKEGIYLINTTKEFESVRYKKLDSINGVALESIIDDLRNVISSENESYFKQASVQYLIIPEVLKGLNINSNEVEFTFIDLNGVEETVKSKPVKQNEIDVIKDDNFPLYRTNRDKYYWYEYLEEDSTMFVKYNVCANMSDLSFSEFTDEVFKLIEEKSIEKLVVDLRDNGGGNSLIFRPFLNKIEKSKINDMNNLFVIVGRKTFSSALLNTLELDKRTNATFIGEPTGGKPNHYGEVRRMDLTNIGFYVSYSTNYFEYTSVDTDSFMPDITIEPSIADYYNSKDSVLNYITK